MKRRFALLLCFCLTLVGTTAQAAPADPADASSPAPAHDDALYRALGEQAGIARLIDHLVPRVYGDPAIGRFFAHSVQAETGRQLKAQFCVVTGGPCVYDGATMKKAHADLGIDKASFNRLVELLQESMDACDIAFADQNRLLARLAPMHRDVITVR